MPARVTNCPNCGGQVEFRANTSLLSVCPYCTSAIARVGDDITDLEILGRVAPLADLGSALKVGTFGKAEGGRFTLVGRVQLDHGAGPWNEWYAAFDDGRWGWLAEAQGRLYLTFHIEMSAPLPRFSQARPGARFAVGGTVFVVVERQRAEFRAAEGELPFCVPPGTHFHYVDLQGPGGVFGTIDYGTGQDAEALFVGREQRYDDFFARDVLENAIPREAAGSVGLNCPNCGSGLELRAPDEAQRVTCGMCGSLLDCGQGRELFLINASKHPGPSPVIPVGSAGRFFSKKWTVYGHLLRSVVFDGERFEWEEYLLRGDVNGGYRWLVQSDGHWSWLDPVQAGDVSRYGPRAVEYGGTRFRHFSSASVRVDALRGEFYWKVAVGEQVGVMDFVAPPSILSREVAADEVNWSVGRYIEPEDVMQAFHVQRLPRRRGVAPHQPNPHGQTLKSLLVLGALFSAMLVLIAFVMAVASDEEVVLQQVFDLRAVAVVASRASPVVKGQKLESSEFEIRGPSNVAVRVTTNLLGGWLYADGRLINTTLNEEKRFGARVQRHSGRARTVLLGELSTGRYKLWISPDWYRMARGPSRLEVRVVRDVFLGSHAVTILMLLWVLPILQGMRYYGFEKARWAQSDHAE